ncbi:MAG: 7TM-DISM domain-containing protein, partial [Pseudobdellovibrionaceae bacterium]|nr:7TM-DISM domain-containing protein [Pseudobdellovibrionaceae bacterium]
MFRLLILISWMFVMPSALGAEEEPTFIIESDRFSMRQANDYRVGNMKQALTDAEMLKIFNDHAYEKTDRFTMKYKQYLYFVYVLDNRSGRTQTVYLRYPMWFKDSKTWLLQGQTLIPLKHYPRWGDTHYIELPPGVHRVIGRRFAETEQAGKAVGVKIYDFETLEKDWRGFEIYMSTVFGAVVVMMFYNFGMYLVYRRIYFLFYIIYSGAALYALAMISGYLPYQVPLLSLGGLVGTVALLLFCNSSLNLRQKHRRLFQSSLVCGSICLALSVFSMITGHWGGFSLAMPIVMSYCLVVSVASLRSGYRPALYFVLGWGIFLVCCSLVVINVAVWNLSYFNYLVIFGFAAEISLFSFAIGQKVRLAEQEAMRANEHAFIQLK